MPEPMEPEERLYRRATKKKRMPTHNFTQRQKKGKHKERHKSCLTNKAQQKNVEEEEKAHAALWRL